MESVIISIVGIAEAAVFIGIMFASIAKKRGTISANLEKMSQEVDSRTQLISRVQSCIQQMLPASKMEEGAAELKAVEDALRMERGRRTVTQAELETVENRLRELEEIERELEASSIETKEELNILKKKEKELSAKNDALKTQIAGSMEQMEKMLAEVEMNAQMAAQIQSMRSQIMQAEERIDTLLLQIEQGNDQYFILKQRYDALDIEYAQLYEKFSVLIESRSGG